MGENRIGSFVSAAALSLPTLLEYCVMLFVVEFVLFVISKVEVFEPVKGGIPVGLLMKYEEGNARSCGGFGCSTIVMMK